MQQWGFICLPCRRRLQQETHRLGLALHRRDATIRTFHSDPQDGQVAQTTIAQPPTTRVRLVRPKAAQSYPARLAPFSTNPGDHPLPARLDVAGNRRRRHEGSPETASSENCAPNDDDKAEHEWRVRRRKRLVRERQLQVLSESLERVEATPRGPESPPTDNDSSMRLFKKWKISVKYIEHLYRHPEQVHAVHPKLRRRLAWILSHEEDVLSMVKMWQRQDIPLRNLPDLLEVMLSSYPERLPVFLSAILALEESPPPPYLIEDCMYLLVDRLRIVQEDDLARASHVRRLLALLKTIHESSPEGYYQLRQHTLWTLIDNLKRVEDVEELYGALVDYGQAMWPHTLLQFASRFADDASYKVAAVEILEHLVAVSDTFRLNEPASTSVCTSILTKPEGEGGDSNPFQPVHLTQRLLGIGMQPNLITWTVIIQNLFRAGELETAWSVLDMALAHGLKPDADLLTVLLAGSKRPEDWGSLRRAVSLTGEHFHPDTTLWNDFLHAVSLWERWSERRCPGHFWDYRLRLMLRTYKKLFQVEPLVHLCGDGLDAVRTDDVSDVDSELVPMIESIPELQDKDLLVPDHVTLSIMVQAYVEAMMEPSEVFSFYSRFRDLLEKRDHAASDMVVQRGSQIHDVVINALCRLSPGSPETTFSVLGDMIEGGTAETEDAPHELVGQPTARQRNTTGAQEKQRKDDESAEGGRKEDHLAAAELDRRRRIHPHPSLYSWNMLLDSLMEAGHARHAEFLLRKWNHLTRLGGVKPDLSTWNIMVKGHARLKDTSSCISALRRLQAAGFTADDYTIRAFNYLPAYNKPSALAWMEKVLKANKARLDGNGRDDAGGETKETQEATIEREGAPE